MVDVSVIDKDGTPLKGLQADDFTVRIDGAPRRVASLKFVDQAAPPGAASVPTPATRYSSNESEGPGRLIVILVDEISIHFGGLRAAAESIDRLLDGFGPTDRIALASLPGPRMLLGFTSDRARIAAAVKEIQGDAEPERLPGEYYISIAEAFAFDRGDTTTMAAVVGRECPQAPPGCSTQVGMEARMIVADQRNRTAEFVSGLKALLNGLRTIDAPKLVVLFSEGFPSPEAPIGLVALGADAAAARAVIYAMRLDRWIFDVSRLKSVPIADALEEREKAILGLDALAGAARGTTFEIIGSAEDPFKRLAAEVSGYYLLGVETEAPDRTGGIRQIRVAVARPGVTLRYRRDFTWRPVVKDEATLFKNAMASPLTASDLPLKVLTFNLAAEAPDKVHVLVEAEIDRAQTADGSAYVGFLLTDDNDRLVVTTGRRMALARAESGALLFVGSFSVAPGVYTMRFAAVHDGKVGSVDRRVTARLTSAGTATGKPPVSPVLLGDLVVMAPLAADQGLRLPLEPRVRGDGFVSFCRVLIDHRTTSEWRFIFDVLKQEQGPVVLSVPGTFDLSAKGSAGTVQANFDARLLPPGDYVMRLTVTAGGSPVATLFAPFTLERTPSSAMLAGRPPTTGPRGTARPPGFPGANQDR